MELLLEKEWMTYRQLTTGLLRERKEGGREEGGRHGENRKYNEQWKRKKATQITWRREM